MYTKGEWKRGKTLLTQQTASWTREQRKANDGIEESMIFSNFSQQDQGKSRQLICTVARENYDYEANAQLIASAPELLEAYKDLVKAHKTKMGKSAVQLRIDLAKQVIKKAEG